jgi:hypothetical protein
MSIDKMPWLYDSESVRGWRVLKAGLAFLVLGAFLVWYLFHLPVSGTTIQDRGTRVEGKVFRMGTTSKGENRLSYGFHVDGKLISVQERRVDDFGGLKQMGPLEIWYDPEDPQRCTTEGEIRAESMRLGPLGIILVLLAVMGFCGFQVYLGFRPTGKAILGN